MSDVPSGKDEADDADGLYRRASAQDHSRPGERVRRRVLEHAAQLAAERAAQQSAATRETTRGANRRWHRPAIFGTLAAAALAGLLLTPRFLTPEAPPMAALPPPAAWSPPAASPPAAESRLQEAGSPAPSVQADRMAAAPAEFAAKSSPATPRVTTGARGKTASSDAREADAQPDPAVAASGNTMAAAGPTAARTAPAPISPDPAAVLRHAAETGDVAQLHELLGRPLAVDARDDNGRTALLLAVLHGQSRAVDVLLAHGADPNAADTHGVTPLQAAVAGHQEAIAATLRRAGAR